MQYKRADHRNPFMGLDNKICEDPVYWCRTKQVWLSEKDVTRKKCLNKPTFDMIGVVRGGSLEKKR